MRYLSLKNVLYIGIIALAGVMMWYVLQVPSNDRSWSPDQQILPHATFNGGEVTVFNIRNFTYDTVRDYSPAYYDKTFDLSELISVDYIVEPFGSIGAAHTFVSFGFSTGDYLAISIEIRKEIDESFSPVKGMLRQYELMYVIADERDVVQLRSNYRENDVRLYPVMTSQENMQRLFIDMLSRANALKADPEFYNTLTNNCTTNIARHINDITPNKIPWDIRLLLPENSDVVAYELGLLDTSFTLEELRNRHLINEKAQSHAGAPNFSKLIR